MSLDLDKRHRAMLREMGVRVWLPVSPAANASMVTAEVHIEPASADTVSVSATATAYLDQQNTATVLTKDVPVTAPILSPVPPAVRSSLSTQPTQAASSTSSPPSPAATNGVAVSWRMGEATALYADTAQADGARWLVLVETSTATLQIGSVFNPFLGDAGKLLDNMLRAARLNQAGVVLLAPLTRHVATETEQGIPVTLEALVTNAQPDVVLVMGRLAAQALLQSDEAFGKLRGQVHTLHNAKTVVTYDATYLLRNQADKAKAWDDLCLAISVVAAPLAS